MVFTLIIFILLLSCILMYLYHYNVRYGKYGQIIDRIPGPPTVPIFGNIFMFSNLTLEGVWQLQCTLSKNFSPIFKIWSITSAYVAIFCPDDVQVILNSTNHLEKGFIYKLIHSWLRTGLLTSTGAKWQGRRKILTPAFHFNILKQFVDIFIEEGNRMTKFLNDMDGSIVKDLVSFISEHTLNAICETSMGVPLKNMNHYGEQYRHAVHEMGEILVYRLIRPWYYSDVTFALTSESRKQAKNLKILHGFTETIIAERKRYHELTDGRYLQNFEIDALKETNDNEMINYKKKRLAMLDLLIAASRDNKINDLDIREEIDTFMFEGHDTVAMAICFSILLLAEHKDIQELARNEVSAVMQENEGKLTITALQNLPYLERCLKEAMRLYPSVPLISRILSEDVKLQSYIIPSTTEIFINIYELHRNPNYWSHPEKFDPDRFLPENSHNRHPYSYVPFSAGPRNCIGQRFAMLELKAMVAPLLHNFYLEPVDYLKDLRHTAHIIKRVVEPIRVRFVPIKRM
ncbi:cytochrome P450 4C1-like [Nylanderia fulva]|uniref:cytochrome P450 4C1-like n=1 Tax=Nylanderia fulva TaxID=613905 RepID=UPI0010FB1448|nr:cytochrome P450 4C1-like [Nylanderia fulva]